VFPFLPLTDERTTINGVQIKGPGSPFNGDSDWNGADGVPLNQLWDTQTSGLDSVSGGGMPNYTVNYVANGDCIEPSVHVLTAN
jgi:hypothetical protein